MQQHSKLSISYLLDPTGECPCYPQHPQQPQQPQQLQPSESTTVQALVALKTILMQRHEETPSSSSSTQQLEPNGRTRVTTTTRSSLILLNGLTVPTLLPQFTREETTTCTDVFESTPSQHPQRPQHPQHAQQPQPAYTRFSIETFGDKELSSSSTIGKKRKLSDLATDTTTTTTTTTHNTHNTNNTKNKKSETEKEIDTKKQKAKKRRIRPSKEQATYLDEFFKSNQHPDTPTRHNIAQTIQMPPKAVCTWFQNKRARTKRALKKQKGMMVFHSSSSPSTQHNDTSSPMATTTEDTNGNESS